jgi:hypothetical protein
MNVEWWLVIALVGWGTSVVGWVVTLLLWHPWRHRRLVVKCEHDDCQYYQVVDAMEGYLASAYHPETKTWPPPPLVRK